MSDRIEEIRNRLTVADIKGPLTAELDIFDPDGLEIVASVYDEKLTFLYTSGSGVTHKGDTQAERDACWEAAKAALPVAQLFANAPSDIAFLLAEVEHQSAQLARIKAALLHAGCSDYTDDVARMAEEFLAQGEEG